MENLNDEKAEPIKDRELDIAHNQNDVNQSLKERDLNFDEKLRLRELELKEKEVELKYRESKKINPILVGIIVAIIGLFSNAIVSYLNGLNQIRHLNKQLENQLIIRAVSSDSVNINKNNLEFLLNVGLIDDSNNKIRKVIEDPESKPQFVIIREGWEKSFDDLKSALIEAKEGDQINASVDKYFTTKPDKENLK